MAAIGKLRFAAGWAFGHWEVKVKVKASTADKPAEFKRHTVKFNPSLNYQLVVGGKNFTVTSFVTRSGVDSDHGNTSDWTFVSPCITLDTNIGKVSVELVELMKQRPNMIVEIVVPSRLFIN